MAEALEKEFAEPYTQWKANPNPATTGSLLRSVDPVISMALYSYGAPSPTLRSKAKQLAIESFNSYDPNRGKLRTHMLNHMKRLYRTTGQEQQIIRTPERVSMNRLEVSRATAELEEQLGRAPSDQELADHTGLSKQRLANIGQYSRPISTGTLASASEMDDAGEMAVEPVYEPKQHVWLDFVYDDLPPTDQYIMERVLGMHGHRKQGLAPIARQLRLSTGAISQRLARIQMKLDKLQDLQGLS